MLPPVVRRRMITNGWRCQSAKENLTVARTTLAVGRLALAAMLACGSLGGWPSIASAAENFKMGVVDPQVVLEKSKAGRRALAMLKQYAAARQKIIAEDETELRSLEKELKEGEGKLKEAEQQKLQTRFRVKLQSYQRRVQEFNQELAVKQKELVDEYMEKIQGATRKVAERGGYKLVVDKGSDNTIKIVIYHRAAIDLTEKVIKEFDRQNK